MLTHQIHGRNKVFLAERATPRSCHLRELQHSCDVPGMDRKVSRSEMCGSFIGDFPIKPPFTGDFPASHVWWNQRVHKILVLLSNSSPFLPGFVMSHRCWRLTAFGLDVSCGSCCDALAFCDRRGSQKGKHWEFMSQIIGSLMDLMDLYASRWWAFMDFDWLWSCNMFNERWWTKWWGFNTPRKKD